MTSTTPAKETPLFTRTFDFLAWLISATNHFPRSQRFLITKRLVDAALDFQEIIIEANNCRGTGRLSRLYQADTALDKVRLYLRLSARWHWLTAGQYQHGAGMITEMGKLLGSWQKQTKRSLRALR